MSGVEMRAVDENTKKKTVNSLVRKYEHAVMQLGCSKGHLCLTLSVVL